MRSRHEYALDFAESIVFKVDVVSVTPGDGCLDSKGLCVPKTARRGRQEKAVGVISHHQLKVEGLDSCSEVRCRCELFEVFLEIFDSRPYVNFIVVRITIVYEKLGRSRIGENVDVESRNFKGTPDLFHTMSPGDVEIINGAVGFWSKYDLFRR